MSERSEWISLGEAASILGVHPSTVRHWADNGDLPSQRTPGGHRRFRRSDLEQWARLRNRGGDPSTAEAQLMLQNALGRARLELGDGQLRGEPWYDQLEEQARRQHGQLGRQLLEVLSRFLTDPDDEVGLLEEVREFGVEYAHISRSQGLTLTQSVRAFIFFRDMLTDSIVQMAEHLSLRTPTDWGYRLRQLNRVTDKMLLALIETYEQTVEG
ncbi:MAG: helix-turn-helix domain-containing protein [Chloroflexi bacterium]|nr:helix-turn-helix domain-containing protein [Chloroflexota bacterium]